MPASNISEKTVFRSKSCWKNLAKNVFLAELDGNVTVRFFSVNFVSLKGFAPHQHWSSVWYFGFGRILTWSQTRHYLLLAG